MNRGTSWAVVLVTAATVWMVSTQLNRAEMTSKSGAGTRVAVLDMVRVFNDFEQTKVLNQKLLDHRQTLGQEADKKMKEIDAKKAERDNFIADTSDWFQRDRAYKELMAKYKVWETLQQDGLAQDHMSWVKRTYQMITQEVEKVAKAHGVQLVVTQEELETANVPDSKAMVAQILNRKVVFADESIDLTKEVLTNINAAFQKAGGDKSVKFSVLP